MATLGKIKTEEELRDEALKTIAENISTKNLLFLAEKSKSKGVNSKITMAKPYLNKML